MSQFNRIAHSLTDIKIRTKMIFLVTGIVLICVVPLSLIVLYRNQAVVLDKTFEVCRNLANNIANLATEELLINETYDATRTSLSRLKESNISGLLDSYVVNVDGKYVAELSEKNIGKMADRGDLKYFASLSNLELSELQRKDKTVLRFSYPIFIDYKKEKMRVGTAVFEFDRDKVYEPVVQIRTTILGVASVLFIFGIIIALYIAFYFARPIHKLSEGARIIGDGNLNHRIKLTGKDELGQLASSFNHMTSQIQDFTHNLELKVAQRTEELNLTLQQVQALKVAQDGDYYLTSLLLEPLQPNNNSSSHVKTEFMIEQKKKFVFRQWESQIGGDICITDTIRLSDRDYTVFINGDAMGKSIQGAGGALVLGVVFNAGLMRSRLARNQKLYPEIWLRERFLDLHNVFISFDGSMYISVCMGLVDNETGVMYYINAEHPWTVLYRDGKASFLEEELGLRKLGTPEQEEKFYVRMFQLAPGDVVITGSDGRDDLLIKNSKGGDDVINEDETQFLRRVEDGKGQIGPVAESVLQFGKLMDDFSLLRLSYMEDEEESTQFPQFPYDVVNSVSEGNDLVAAGKEDEAFDKIENLFEANPKFPDLLKLLGKLYFHKGDIPKAIECFEQYLGLNPGDNEYVYVLSNAYRMADRFNEAVDAGERLFLREPRNFLNLVNLAATYLELKILRRAEIMINRALDMNPDDKNANNLAHAIDEVKRSGTYDSEFEKQSVLSMEELEVHIKKADSQYEKKNFGAAKLSYEKILKKDDHNAYALFRIANCCVLLKNLDDAVKYYNRSLFVTPNNYHARNNLASTYFRLNKYDLARDQWIKALEINPSFRTAEINLKHLEKIENNRKAIA
ncbi:MAG: tetratricopeptide repeat protein [Leptospira sp.]|nr:tetratricopeptide repeat protein [Leptospira sp.]